MEKNPTVLITGSTRGLGRGLAQVFAEKGYNLIIHGRDSARISELKDKFSFFDICCERVIGDLLEPDTINQLTNLATQRNLDILINNAAMNCPGKLLEDISTEELIALISTNLTAPMLLTHAIYPLFLKKGAGTIVNVSSLSGLESQMKRTAYCGSKWGLRGFTETLRKEAEPRNIRVIGVYASRIKTRPEFSYGMEIDYASRKIYEGITDKYIKDIVLDERPEQFKKKNEKT